MKTYQDYEKAPDKLRFLCQAVGEYRSSEEYRIAEIADEYERQRNVTIRQYCRYLYDAYGRPVQDFTAANNRLCNNFFHRLNTQRCTYSLGNGVTFPKTSQKTAGSLATNDTTKERLGNDFDTDLYNAAYAALIHGVSYIFWNGDRAHVFPMTQFCPLYDEETGKLRAGIRFWSLEWGKRPVEVVFYTEEGFIRYRSIGNSLVELQEIQPLRGYLQQVATTQVDGDEVVGESNYGSLPIVPLYGSRRKQSTLVGLRDKLDSYDLIQSGFADTLQDCAEIYWIISNAMGMTESDLAKFRDRMKLQHIVAADTDNSAVTAYTQDIPFQARKEFLDGIRTSIFEDFGALDVHTISAGTTNDHIDAAYQPLDEEADEFEYEIINAVRQILALIGVDDVPSFKRNRVSNQKEQTEMVMSTADILDPETIVNHLPFITVDEREVTLSRMDAQAVANARNLEQLAEEGEMDEAGQDQPEDGEA